MRIMQIATNFEAGGIQRHVLELTTALRDSGHQVMLCGDEGSWRPEADDPGFLPLPLTSLTSKGGSSVYRLARLPHAVKALRRGLTQFPCDLIHAHETAPLLVARLASLGSGRPIAMTFHGSAPEREREVARQGRLLADHVVSPSRAALDRLIAHGLPPERCRVLGLGVPPFPPITPERVAERRAKLLGPHDGPLVLSLSRMAVQKGLDDMIAVAQRVVSRHPGAVFAVGGSGELAATVAGWAAQSGLGDRFRLLGPVSAVAEHLLAADLFLLTSRWENLPISIVEAFRAGLPVVATDCGGVRELVDGDVGSLAQVGDVEGIADTVDQFLADASLRSATGTAAFARSQEARFDPKSVHAGFAAFYDEILSHRT